MKGSKPKLGRTHHHEREFSFSSTEWVLLPFNVPSQFYCQYLPLTFLCLQTLYSNLFPVLIISLSSPLTFLPHKNCLYRDVILALLANFLSPSYSYSFSLILFHSFSLSLCVRVILWTHCNSAGKSVTNWKESISCIRVFVRSHTIIVTIFSTVFFVSF